MYMSKLKDDDEIQFHFYFDNDFKSVSVEIHSEKSLDAPDIATCLRDFAQALDEGRVSMFDEDETAFH